MFGIRRRLLGRIRRFNRWWIDALAPAAAPAPRDPPPPAPVVPTRPAVVVTSEDTPNPDARKFTATVPVVRTGSISFSNPRAAADHPLGRAIFEIGGVRSLFATGDFLTVTRSPGADWAEVSPAVEAALARVLASG
jgi:hypothetical protein